MNRLNFGFIGVGQCGGNIANTFAGQGFDAIALNTSQVDLDLLHNIPNNRRKLINLGLHGAGKNPEIGKAALEHHVEEILSLVIETFTTNTEMLFVCAGLGGGTGSGATPLLMEILCDHGYPVGAIVTIPSDTEGHKTKTVFLRAIEEIAALEKLGGVFIVDNGKTLTMPKHIGKITRYELINESVASKFENLSLMPSMSSVISFDERDLISTLLLNGCAGMVSVPLIKAYELKDANRFVKNIVSAFSYSVFADTHISQARAVVLLFEIKRDQEQYLNAELEAELSSFFTEAEIGTGVYINNDVERESAVHILLTGMPYPQARILAIQKDIEKRALNINTHSNRLTGIDFSKIKQISNDLIKETELKPAKPGESVLDRILKNRVPR